MVGIPAFYEKDRTNRNYHVKHRAFCIGASEVTVDAYGKCVAAGECTQPIAKAVGNECNWRNPSSRGDHPINCVDWHQASAYCSWLGGRLPQRDEWNWAVFGTSKAKYPWGNDAPKDQLCWNGQGNGLGEGLRRSTCPVGSYPVDRNPWGMMDIAGNVSEWTATTQSRNMVVVGGWSNGHTFVEESAEIAGESWRKKEISSAWSGHKGQDLRIGSETVGIRCIIPTTQMVYTTAQRPAFLTQFSDATVLDFNTRADGSIPVDGTTFPSTEYAAKGVVITVSSADTTASLIWKAKILDRGFGLEVTCSNPGRCNADIVVTFSAAQCASGFDFGAIVEAIWKQPDGAVIEGTGTITRSGYNFAGLYSTEPIGSVTLRRADLNVIDGLEYLARTSCSQLSSRP
jgi:Sulfatase-modifying factor enzyme 1